METPDDATTTPFLARSDSFREHSQSLQSAASSNGMLVRETAAEQLDERRIEWLNSKPVVVLDVLWNSAFVILGVVVLVLSRDERPSVPLRVWILGFGSKCLVHVACEMVEFRRRVRSTLQIEDQGNSIVKNVHSANTMYSFIWWIIGVYWLYSGRESLAVDSPQLYWLCVIFLAFGVCLVVFCIALACVAGIAVFCCFPCIIARLHAVAGQEGASKEDVEQLTKYKFHRIGDVEKLSNDIKGSSGGIMTECNTDTPMEHVLSKEDAECCICLSSYDNGVELRELPCGHHFHCACVDKWLLISANCPLCKYNILKSSNHDHEEV